ncbi:MAG: hypothetical protein ACI9OH_004001, partial [Oleispira sp.]
MGFSLVAEKPLHTLSETTTSSSVNASHLSSRINGSLIYRYGYAEDDPLLG